jgi:hypothetical protein
MAPSIVTNVTEAVSELSIKGSKGQLQKEPLKYSGSLDRFSHEDLTPSTGTEFSSSTQLSQLLSADNADELIRDLAILGTSPLLPNSVSQRIVVIFRNQDINIETQKLLGTKLGELSGKPSTSKLHTHPTLYTSELGEQISVIDTAQLYPRITPQLIPVTGTTPIKTSARPLRQMVGTQTLPLKKSPRTTPF